MMTYDIPLDFSSSTLLQYVTLTGIYFWSGLLLEIIWLFEFEQFYNVSVCSLNRPIALVIVIENSPFHLFTAVQ